jgi:hypothetical protein
MSTIDMTNSTTVQASDLPGCLFNRPLDSGSHLVHCIHGFDYTGVCPGVPKRCTAVHTILIYYDEVLP